MKRLFAIWMLVLSLSAVFMPAVAFAADEDPRDLQPVQSKEAGLFAGVSTKCWKNGSCNLCDAMIVFVNIANGILALLAIVAVIYFVYGAGYLALSNGNENYVHTGQEAIKASIIGTIIVLAAWQIMAFVVLITANRSELIGSAVKPVAKDPITAWYTVTQWCKQ